MSRTLSAESFRDFINAERVRIHKAFEEVEQVQVEYQGAYTRFKAAHDRTLSALADQVEANADRLDAALCAQIDARVPVEGQAIAERIAKLDKEMLPKLQQLADALINRVQKDIADLREINPKLNDREETLKRDLAHRQQTLDALNAQVSAFGSGLGVILHARKIHDLDRERFRAIGRLESLAEELKKVRQEWNDLHAMVDKKQAEAKAQWQTTMAQMGQLQAEREHLTQNAGAVARRRAIVYVLDNLKTLSSAAEAASAARLKPMIELNIQTDDFQAALGSVAGILGILKGVDEGLRRFGESVKALADEQSRHSTYLPPLQIELADDATAFGATWDDLAAKAKDEKTLAQHPGDFVAAMKPFLDERLTNDHIAGFFDALGKTMKQATSKWKGK